MIDTTDPTVRRLADAWRHISDTSPADEAGPLVLDCARRLAADPGGERAHLWVAGLVAMSGHLAWRPGREARRAAVDALCAAVKALDGRPCAHDDHPFEAAMDALEDEIWLGDTGLLPGGPAAPNGDPDAGRVLCPVNVAGWARLAADVIAPFSVRRVPVGSPEGLHFRMRVLSGIVNDHPHGDPGLDLIGEAGLLPDRPTRGVLAGFLVTMNATCWYATSERITDPAVLKAMIAGIEAAVPLLDDAPCAHGPGEHPGTGDPDDMNQAGFLLRSPGGRAELAEPYGWDEEDEAEQDDEPLDAWVCPAFLEELADDTLGELRAGLRALRAAEDGDEDDEE
ncbi:hypothetical protein [Streptomyces cinnamoneus]|uniref:hypothetical protein n=1 Tax=Streptomyces cinnamoneus TaxID=53446 RepID=UPI0011B0C4C1|nr:hypothetical protein [Streptomyces cinnamoneus]